MLFLLAALSSVLSTQAAVVTENQSLCGRTTVYFKNGTALPALFASISEKEGYRLFRVRGFDSSIINLLTENSGIDSMAELWSYLQISGIRLCLYGNIEKITKYKPPLYYIQPKGFQANALPEGWVPLKNYLGNYKSSDSTPLALHLSSDENIPMLELSLSKDVQDALVNAGCSPDNVQKIRFKITKQTPEAFLGNVQMTCASCRLFFELVLETNKGQERLILLVRKDATELASFLFEKKKEIDADP